MHSTSIHIPSSYIEVAVEKYFDQVTTIFQFYSIIYKTTQVHIDDMTKIGQIDKKSLTQQVNEAQLKTMYNSVINFILCY